MAILLPVAQQFVIIGKILKETLEKNELFIDYFNDKQEKLMFVGNVSDIDFDSQTLNKTLFVIKHFDYDAVNSDDQQLSVSHNNSASTNYHITNNNHILNSSNTLGGVEEERDDEMESGGYTTDYDELVDDVDANYDTQSVHSDSDFDRLAFRSLTERKCSIIGSIALLQSIKSLKSLDENIKMVLPERPLHNLAMQNMMITFNLDNFITPKTEAQQLLTLTRWMGAKSREEVKSKTTHLVADNSRKTKYRRAAELGIAIMSTTWVYESFKIAQRDDEFNAGSPGIIQTYKLKPFHGLHLAFQGFKEEDVKELRELTISNGGILVDANSLSCTHIVMDAISGYDENNCQLPACNINQSSNAHVVYKEWFWASLEMEGKANEVVYAVPGFEPLSRRTSKVRSSVGYNSFNVLSPMLDYSRSPEAMYDRRVSRAQSSAQILEEEKQPLDLDKITARHRACLELIETERNYVRILDTIVNLFKLPLEAPETGDPILPATEVKIIFGNIAPIHNVHKRMLNQLEDLIQNDWKETNLVGKVFVSHSIDLLKAYPTFINFFEDTKKTIQTCDFKYPRFHAFLKKCQSKIECNRESLSEMIIRPVQRLPSISLIITELIKRTDDSNPDKKYLKEALESIKRVMNLINEDKRKTEGQIAMFDIVNSIEDCPPDLLSALRRFICKVEARLLFMNSESEVIPSKSHKIILFLFSDLIEICKVRSLKRSHSVSTRTYVPIRRNINPLPASKYSTNNRKDYRHLDGLQLFDIKNIYRRFQSSELEDAIVIQARPSLKYDKNFRYYPIILEDQSMTKDMFVEKLENCLFSGEADVVSDYVPNDSPISNDEIDFSYANLLVHTMEKSRLSRVLSIRQVLLSPSMKGQRNVALS